MRVKVGDAWYDSDETPICVQFGEAEFRYVKDEMTEETAPSLCFAQFPGGFGDAEQMRKWIREGR